MDPVLRVALAFALFASPTSAWPGRRFASAGRAPRALRLHLCFTLVAWITFGAAISTYAAHAE